MNAGASAGSHHVRRVAPVQSALVLALLALAPGCHRKAPGPEECRGFAYHVFNVQSENQLALPGMLGKVNELTTECLLTPYDRELMSCVEAGEPPSLCMRAFALRSGAGPRRVRASPR